MSVAARSLSLGVGWASIHARNGNLDDAEAIARQVATAHYEAGNIIGVVWMLHELAAIAARRGFDERVVRLSSAARTLEIDAGGGIDAERLGLTRMHRCDCPSL